MINLPSNARIQIKIKEETSEGNFSDAIYYTAEEWDVLTDKQLEADKQKRIDDWKAIVVVQRAKTPDDIPKEKLEEHKAILEEQISEINTEISKK